MFNEVFLTDATVPAGNVVGEVGRGWQVAMSTLAHERSYMGTGASSGGSRIDVPDMDLTMPVGEVLAGEAAEAGGRAPRLRGYPLVLALARERGLTDDPVVRQELARAYTYGEVGRMTGVRVQAAAALGRRAGPEISVQKLAVSRTLNHLGSLALALEGPAGTLAGDDAPHGDRAFEVMCTAFVNSIGGGTDQIQRNIIGERVLGLPVEPRADKDVPFSELPVTGRDRLTAPGARPRITRDRRPGGRLAQRARPPARAPRCDGPRRAGWCRSHGATQSTSAPRPDGQLAPRRPDRRGTPPTARR